jgi:hypothetical protein
MWDPLRRLQSGVHVSVHVLPLKIRGKGSHPRCSAKCQKGGGGVARAGRRRDLAAAAARAPAERDRHGSKAEPQNDGTCGLNVGKHGYSADESGGTKQSATGAARGERQSGSSGNRNDELISDIKSSARSGHHVGVLARARSRAQGLPWPRLGRTTCASTWQAKAATWGDQRWRIRPCRRYTAQRPATACRAKHETRRRDSTRLWGLPW